MFLMFVQIKVFKIILYMLYLVSIWLLILLKIWTYAF